MRLTLLLLPLILTGCSVNPAQVAADAAFCSSAESLLQNIGDAYEQELVDSELLASASNFFSGLSNPWQTRRRLWISCFPTSVLAAWKSESSFR
jgi:hypothetical protein